MTSPAPPSAPSPPAPGRSDRIRIAALTTLTCAAAVFFLVFVSRYYSIHRWLVWRYVGHFAATLFWGASCLGGGLALLRAMPGGLPTRDRLALAFPVGVFAFFLALFVTGLAGGLGGISFFGLPGILLFAGRNELKTLAVRLLDWRPAFGWRDLPLILFGIAGLVLVYVQIVTPEGASYDARWYHLPLGEDYARSGAIRPSPVGWFLAAYPHLASYLYSWAFSLPVGLLFDRLELCLHLEFLLFVATLASIPALVRRLAPGVHARYAWTAIFLFPSIFLYDGNLHGGADHVAAFWVIPLALAVFRVWSSFTPANCLLFAVFLSGLALTKYSAFCVLPVTLGAFTLRFVWLASTARRRGLSPRTIWFGGLVALAAALVLTTPHWLKNWLWYGDPLYPTLYKHLAVRPWNPDAVAIFAEFKAMMAAARPGLQGLLDALGAVFTFSFIPNDWWDMHRDVPMFGSLFTLLTPCVLFLRQPRLAIGYGAVMSGVFFWYLPHHYDRYLQVLVPWMAACTAAALALMWQTRSRMVKGAVCLLVGAQLIWAADVPFVPTHNLLRDSPIRHTLRFAASGFMGTQGRLTPFGDFGRIGAALPRNAHLLVHESPLQLGIDVKSTQDQWQGLLSYAQLRTPAAIHQSFVRLGITHVMWEPGHSFGWNPLGHDLAFWAYSTNFLKEPKMFGGFAVAPLPERAPPDTVNLKVALWSCGLPYPTGIYDVGGLSVPPGASAATPEGTIVDVGAAMGEVGFLVIEPACAPPMPPQTAEQFHGPFKRGGFQVYVRRSS